MSNLEKLRAARTKATETKATATTQTEELKTKLDFNNFDFKKSKVNEILEKCYVADKENGYKSSYLKDALSKLILLEWTKVNYENRQLEIKYINQSSVITAQLINQMMYISFIDCYEITVIKDQKDFKAIDTFNISLFVKDNMTPAYKDMLNEMFNVHIPTLSSEDKKRQEQEENEKLEAKQEANSIRRANGLKEIEF